MKGKGTKHTGDISESLVTSMLLRRGYNVLRPIGDRLPYDLCIEQDGVFVRIQVKTAYFLAKGNRWYGNTRMAKTNRKTYSFAQCNTKDVEVFIYVLSHEEKDFFYT